MPYLHPRLRPNAKKRVHLRDGWLDPELDKVAARLGTGSCCMVNSQGRQQIDGLTALVHERRRRDVLVALEA